MSLHTAIVAWLQDTIVLGTQTLTAPVAANALAQFWETPLRILGGLLVYWLGTKQRRDEEERRRKERETEEAQLREAELRGIFLLFTEIQTNQGILGIDLEIPSRLEIYSRHPTTDIWQGSK